MKQKVPKGFNGRIYDEGGKVKDFSGKEFLLNNIELSLFDFFSGCASFRDMLNPDEMMTKKRGVLEYSIAKVAVWFRENNPQLFNDLICDFCDWDEEILQFDDLSGNWNN